MKEAKVKQHSVKANILRGMLIGATVLICVVLVSNMFKMRQADERLEKARGALARIEQENEELKRKLDEVKSDEYTEREARDKLGLVYDGEYVVIMPEPDVLKSFSPRRFRAEEMVLPDPNWKKWLKLFL